MKYIIMYKLAFYFSILELTGLFGFIITSRYHQGEWIRFLPLWIAIFLIIIVAYLQVKKVSNNQETVFISLVASVIFICGFKLLGYIFYPGLLKDVDFFSIENATGSGKICLIGTVGHFFLLKFANILRHIKLKALINRAIDNCLNYGSQDHTEKKE